jgi:hypothetical protein
MENFHLQLMEQDNPFAIVSLLLHCQLHNFPHICMGYHNAMTMIHIINTSECFMLLHILTLAHVVHTIFQHKVSQAKAATKIAYTSYEDSVVCMNLDHQMFGKGSGWTYFSS